jgi:hypothetical protein
LQFQHQAASAAYDCERLEADMTTLLRRLRSGILRVALAAALLAGGGLGSGCGEGPPPVEASVNVTIQQGIYGYASFYGDEGDLADLQRPVAQLGVALYATRPEAGVQADPLASTITDDQGFFQLAVAPGRYVLCNVPSHGAPVQAVMPTCADVELGDRIQRWDFSTGFAPTSWDRLDDR